MEGMEWLNLWETYLPKTYVQVLRFPNQNKNKVRSWVEDYENLKEQVQKWTRVLGYLEDL